MSYKVRIRGPEGSVVFEASSPISETRQAAYDGFQIIHLPTSLLAYRNTGGRKWGVQGKLVSRTVQEAQANIRNLDLIRRWVLPEFGGTGATPPILKLYGYNNINIDGRQCILTNYSWTFPEEVDYIWQGGQAMPIIGSLTLDLEEVYSAEQITAKMWRLALTGGGDFKGGGGRSITSAFWTDFGNARTTGGPSYGGGSYGTVTVPDVVRIASALDKAVNDPAAVTSALIATAASTFTNSEVVREVTAQLPTTANSFVSGAAPVRTAPLQPIATSTVQPVIDPYSRSSDLAPPTIIGE